MRKIVISLIVFAMALGFSTPVLLAGEGKIGGNLKLYLWDQSGGTSMNEQKDDIGSMGITSLYMYISRELTEKISIDVQPTISVSTGATPKNGSKIGTTRVAGTVSVGFNRAVIQTALPYSVELSAGLMKPIFTEDYGMALWYEEEYQGNAMSCNSWVGEWKDFGVEIYRPFEIGSISFPVYLYFLNGNNAYDDNNNAKSVLLHLSPEFNFGKWGGLKITGSIATGMWDTVTVPVNPVTRYSAGLAYNWGNLMIRGEYAAGTWSGWNKGWSDGITRDIVTNGCYVKVGYNITPKLRILVDRAVANHNFYLNAARKYVNSPEITMQWIPSINYFIAEDSVIMFQYTIQDTWREDGNASIHYSRGTLGWRTVF